MTRKLPKPPRIGTVSGNRVLERIFFRVRRRCMTEGGPFFEYVIRDELYAHNRQWTPHRAEAKEVNPRAWRRTVPMLSSNALDRWVIVRVLRWRRIPGDPSSAP